MPRPAGLSAEETDDPLDRDAWAAFGKRLEALKSAA
jgi:hypothetical protein